MATPKDKYYTKLLEDLVDYNDRNNAPLSNEKLWQTICTVISETEVEEHNIISGVNNAIIDTFCQSSITTNIQLDIETWQMIGKFLRILLQKQ